MDPILRSIPVSNARQELFEIVGNVNETHKPVQILSKRGNAVLVSEEDWNAIQETLYLLSIPGMKESILQGLHADKDELIDEKDVQW